MNEKTILEDDWILEMNTYSKPKQEELQLSYQVLKTPLGFMFTAASDEGMAIFDFEDRRGLPGIIKEVVKRYSAVFKKQNQRYIYQIEREIEEYYKGDRIAFNVPLDIRGTPFQELVWKKLLQIPYGETRSYGEIASELEKPKSARAVGRANGSNHLAIIIPCHRVIRHDGYLQGYGGGLWRKQRLLDLESKTTSNTIDDFLNNL